MRLDELAARIGAELAAAPDPSVELRTYASLEAAGAQDLAFAQGETWRERAVSSAAGALVVDAPVPGYSGGQLVAANPGLAFARAAALFDGDAAPEAGQDPSAQVHRSASVAASARLEPGVVVSAGATVGERVRLEAGVVLCEGASVGADSRLAPGVVIERGCRIGERVRIHPNAVIGGDGFGFATDERGQHLKVPQVGIVVVEDDVEIGSCTTIDRARFAETRVRRGAKIDNLVMVAHNVEVGEDCLLVAQCGIAGSTRLGRHVVLGGQAGVAGHVKLGDQVQVAGQSGVGRDLPPKSAWFGSPARPLSEGKRVALSIGRLPKLMTTVRALEARIAELEARAAASDSEGSPSS